jgi:primosomal protein N' (replication factor Y)
VKRAQLEGTPVLLGSATPSLESLRNAARAAATTITSCAAGRAGGELPELSTMDLRGLPAAAGVSEALLAAMRDTVVVARRQALLFLNRRGFAPTLQCHDCGWVAGCEHCDARLTVHLRQRSLRCHHCGARHALPAPARLRRTPAADPGPGHGTGRRNPAAARLQLPRTPRRQ